MLPTVHAYRDDGPQAEKTRWKPRRVFCTLESDHRDAPGILYVAKFAVGSTGAAALISEVVCTTLLGLAGIRTLSPVIVRASEGFAASCNRMSDFPGPITAGDYFGTLHRGNVEAGPPPGYDYLAQPLELLRLWVFDSWLCNIDREVEGNILLSLSTGGRFRVIAADQSDCFCGASVFCSGGFQEAMRVRRSASSVPLLVDVIFRDGGPPAIRRACAEVRATVPRIQEALELVPPAWWNLSSRRPADVREILEFRAGRLEEILNPNQWEVPNADNAILL
jgi:hypothetical protein